MCCLLAGPWTSGRCFLLLDWYTVVCIFFFLPSAFSFSSKYLLLFLKPRRCCVLFLPILVTSLICPSMASWSRQFLLRKTNPIFFFYVRYYLEVSSSLVYVQELIIIYFYCLFFHRRPTQKFCFLFCRPFVVNATFSTGLVVFSVSCPS